MSNAYYIGVMSGTSMDGIDIALCEIGQSDCRLIDFEIKPFDAMLKKRCLEAMHRPLTLEAYGKLDKQLGVMFAESIASALDRFGMSRERIKAVGLHGQTLWHHPQGAHPFTMQLGDGHTVSASLGIPVVGDLRRADMARGGQGAPLAPPFHAFLFQDSPKPFGVLNLGGIANITVVTHDTVIGYDTGPANALLDAMSMRYLGQPYDEAGRWARSGTLDSDLLSRMLDDPYFRQSPPKSTGKEYFNLDWVARYQKHDDTPRNVQRTLVELTARSAVNELKRYGIKRLYVGGGGVCNAFLIERIDDLIASVSVAVAPFYDAMEAMMTAWYAAQRIAERPVALSSVTGARYDGLNGVLYHP